MRGSKEKCLIFNPLTLALSRRERGLNLLLRKSCLLNPLRSYSPPLAAMLKNIFLVDTPSACGGVVHCRIERLLNASLAPLDRGRSGHNPRPARWISLRPRSGPGRGREPQGGEGHAQGQPEVR